MGIGWQEILVIMVALVMCVGFFGALSLPFIILIRRFRRSRQPTGRIAQQPAIRPEPGRGDSPWGQTKFGFDDSDWGSEFDDEHRDDDPRSVVR